MTGGAVAGATVVGGEVIAGAGTDVVVVAVVGGAVVAGTDALGRDVVGAATAGPFAAATSRGRVGDHGDCQDDPEPAHGRVRVSHTCLMGMTSTGGDHEDNKPW